MVLHGQTLRFLDKSRGATYLKNTGLRICDPQRHEGNNVDAANCGKRR